MDIHFNGYKVKYAMLNYLLNPIRRAHNIKSMNIFIDLDDLYHTLRKPIIDKEFQACAKDANIQLISNIINIAGHYRNYCIKEGIFPRIFIVYTSNNRVFRNNTYIHDYRRNFIDKSSLSNGNYFFINTAINNSREVMHLISDYIEDVYVIDSIYLEPSIIPYFIANEDKYKANWNLVISRDSYMVQYSYMDKFSMISPKGDNTIYINKANMWRYVNYREKIYKEDLEELNKLSPNLFISAKAVVGDRYRNIPRLNKIGWKTLLNYLLKDIDKDSSEELQLRKFIEFIKKKKVNDYELENNIYCTNIRDQYISLLDSDKGVIRSTLVDMSDYESLLELNKGIFNKYPFNLNFLFNRIKEV